MLSSPLSHRLKMSLEMWWRLPRRVKFLITVAVWYCIDRFEVIVNSMQLLRHEAVLNNPIEHPELPLDGAKYFLIVLTLLTIFLHLLA